MKFQISEAGQCEKYLQGAPNQQCLKSSLVIWPHLKSNSACQDIKKGRGAEPEGCLPQGSSEVVIQKKKQLEMNVKSRKTFL